MDAFFDLPWRHGPALVLIVFGTVLAVRGLREMPNPIGPTFDLMAWMHGFRRAVVGLALAIGGLAWLCQLPWLLAIALGVGLQELREVSSYITTLRRAAATPRSTAPAAPRRARDGGRVVAG